MIYVMGLDCSSTTIGWGLLEIVDSEKVKYIDSGFVKPPKSGTIIERIIETRELVSNLIYEHEPDCIGIEEIIQFMSGKSTAKTIITLTTFNRMICLLCYDCLKKQPELFNVMTIRHGLKFNKILPKKEDMPELIAKHLNISFPYILNKKKKPKPENNDVADGLAVALYYSFILNGKIVNNRYQKLGV